MPFAGLVLAITTSAHAGDIPTLSPIAPLPLQPGTGMPGRIYNGSTVTDLTQAQGTADSLPPIGSLTGHTFNYGPGNATTPLSSWLGSDAPSLTGLPGSTWASSLVYAFDGYLAVPYSGQVQFAVTSGSGIIMRIDDRVVTLASFDRPLSVSNDSVIFTEPGLHRFSLVFWTNNFQTSGLRLEWSQTVNNFTTIPPSAFYAVPAPAASLAVGAGALVAARRRR